MGRKTFERFFLKTFDNGLFFPTDQSFAVPAAGGDGGRARRVLIDWLRCKQRGLEQFGKHTLVTLVTCGCLKDPKYCFPPKKGTLGICVGQKWVRRLHGDLELGSRVPGGMVMDLFAIKVLDGAVDPATKRNL